MAFLSIGPLRGVDKAIARIRDRMEELRRGAIGTIRPQPDARVDGTTNSTVLATLSDRYPRLTAPGPDMVLAAVREAAKSWRPWSSTVRDLANSAAAGAARAIAARLRSGQYVTNNEETLRRKARLGRPPTPGVDTEQLARALDAATADTSTSNG